MKKKKFKPFKLGGFIHASVRHYGSPDGPLIIDLNIDTLTLKKAKKLSDWLLRAIEEVEQSRKKQK